MDMKIIPLHSAEPTFLRLSRFEWGVSLFFALLIPLFLQSLLALFGIVTAVPLYVGLSLVALADLGVVYAKSKEQDFLQTWIGNVRIPDSLVGTHRMPHAPFTPRPVPKEET
jgi:hypothetical protein